MFRPDALYAGFPHLFPGRSKRALHVDRAARVLDYERGKTSLRASSAVHATQKSVASPQTNTRLMRAPRGSLEAGAGLAVGSRKAE